MHSHAGSNSERGLRTAFFLNLAFTLIEIVGGLWTNSVAVLSDAIHDTGDCLALGISWYLERLSRRRPNALFNYGHRRLSTLGGLVTGLILLVGLGFVLTRAVERLISPEEVHANGMIGLAVLGIIVNGAAMLRLRGGSGLNHRVVSWHFLEDTLGWIALLLGAIALKIWQMPEIDSWLSIGISLFVLWNVGRNLRGVLLVFLQAAPSGFDVNAFQRAALRIHGVQALHHTHSWSIDGERHVFSTHAVVEPARSRPEIVMIKARLRDLLQPHHFEHTTIEIEQAGEACQAAAQDESEHGTTAGAHHDHSRQS